MMAETGLVHARLEAQVAAGDDADEVAAVGDRHAGDVVRARVSSSTSPMLMRSTVIGSRMMPAS
jgi:hypothetical protein